MTRGAAEYAVLANALDEHRPACKDDWRYVADEHLLDPAEVAQMRELCRSCPLSSSCAAFAVKARPTAGMWSGRYYSPKKKRGEGDG